MAFQLSPGVSTTEVDLSTAIETVSTTSGAYAGFFRWGPVNQRILLGSEPQMAQILQPPTSNNSVFYWSAADFLSYGNSLYVVRANSSGLVNSTASGSPLYIPNEEQYFHNNMDGNSNTYGPFAARYPGDLGNSLIVSVCPSTTAYSSNLTSSLGITANANTGVLVIPTNSAVTGNIIVGDLVQIGLPSISNGYVAVTAVGVNSITLAGGAVRANGTALPISRKWQYAAYFNGPPTTSVYTSGKSGANDQMHIIVVDANGVFNRSTTADYVLETYPYLSAASDATNNDSTPAFYQTVLFNKSKYIYQMDAITGGVNWGQPAQGTTFGSPVIPTTVELSGGSDITNPYSYTGFGPFGNNTDPNDPGLISAYQYFVSADDVDISLVPTGPGSVNVQQWIMDNIVTVRKDCVEFISPRYGDVVNQRYYEASNIVNSYLPALNRSSSYAVLDSGWKYRFDKYNNQYIYSPLNPDIAGLCVNTDTVRAPWYSPAGYARGAIKNVTKLAWNPSQTYRDLLYPNAINPVASFKGAGTILYGDKTLQYQTSAFDRIGVRRLFIVLEKAIATAAKFSLFEFNDSFTQNAFKNLVNPFLASVQGQRGITNFQVVCDATNNTPQVLEAKEFVGDIYVVPNYSINFIQLNFVCVGATANFTEIVGTVGLPA